MAVTRKNFLLALSALALLSGCDDGQSQGTSWLDWIKGKDEPQGASRLVYPADYVRDTQAGNYLAGQFAQYRQDWPEANKYLDKVMALDPANIELQQRAMVLAMQAGDADRAITLAKNVLKEDGKNLLALLFIGVDQMARQQYPEALKTLAKMPQNGIADFIRPILLAWAKAPEKKFDQEALIVDGPLHAYHALLIADYLGKVKDPERYFVTVLTGGGADKHILEMMGDVYSRQGYTELAKKIYDTLIEDAEKNGATTSRVEFILEKRDDPQKAAGTKIATPAEGSAEAFYNMARLLFQDKSEDSALVFARIAQHLDPSKEDVKMLLAAMMVRSEHVGDAITLYKSVKPGSPGYPESLRSAAELMEEEGRVDEVIRYLEDNYAENEDVNFLIQIGDVYRRAERHAEAIKAYDRVVDLMKGKVSSDYWHVLYARGMSYERVGNMKKAEEDLQAALEFQPDHPYLLNYLGYSWADQGKNLEQALQMVDKAATLKPDDGYIIDSLGWIYYRMGAYEKAVTELEKAVELVPYDPTINDHLGDAYWRVGRKNEARFQWQRAANHSEDKKLNETLEKKVSEGLGDTPVAGAKSPHTEPAVKRP